MQTRAQEANERNQFLKIHSDAIFIYISLKRLINQNNPSDKTTL